MGCMCYLLMALLLAIGIIELGRFLKNETR